MAIFLYNAYQNVIPLQLRVFCGNQKKFSFRKIKKKLLKLVFSTNALIIVKGIFLKKIKGGKINGGGWPSCFETFQSVCSELTNFLNSHSSAPKK